MIKAYLKQLNVPFVDTCCPISAFTTFRVNDGIIEFFNSSIKLWEVFPISGGGSSFSEIIGLELTGITSTTISLSHTPLANSLALYINGLRMTSSQFSYTSSIITLTSIPDITDIITIDYKY